MIVINFKNYVYGKTALNLAKKVKKHLPKAIVAVSAADARGIEYYTRLQVFSQHVDSNNKPAMTGFINIETLKQTKTKGSLLNHSEHRLSKEEIRKTILIANKLEFKILLCVKNLKEAKEYKKFKPYAIAFEDPKLISTRKSITKYNPESIKEFIKILKGTKIIPLCGAGINSKEDVVESKKLGCEGVLIASAIANSKNPDKILKNLE